MVLVASSARVWLLVLMTLGLSACIKGRAPEKLDSPTPIAVAFVHDKGSSLAHVPEALKQEVIKPLVERNLVVQEIELSQFESSFVRKRDSRDRLQAIASHAGQAPLLLLVEMRAEYYSQLNGRYRWTVYVKFTLSKPGDLGGASSASFDLPVMLGFDHQRENEALIYAAGPIARKLGHEVDDFIGGLDLSTSPAQARSSSPGDESLGPIYFVMLDRFNNGDASNDGAVDGADAQAFHGGDIAGLIDKLDYIQELGIKTLWLSPIFKMRTEKIGEHGAFHGYWTEDLRELEPRFGSDKELEALRAQLEARNMNLVLDIVLNHVGYDTRLVKEEPEWFHGRGDIKDWDDPVQLTTYDVHGLPDLNQDKEEVYRFLLDASVHWIEALQPVGFRLDAVKHVGSKFWNRYTQELRRKRPSFAMIGELYNGDPAAIARGFAEGGFSQLFDFPLYFAMTEVFCKGQHAGRLASILSLDRLYPDPSQLVTFADNHDLPRVFSACGEDRAKVRALLEFFLSARGIPALNYGTEAGLAGASEPSNREDMRFEDDPVFARDVRSLLELRGKHAVFQRGQTRTLMVDERKLALLRTDGRESALVLANLGSEAWRYSDENSAAGGVDLRSGEALGPEVPVAPMSVRIVMLEDAVPRSSAPKQSVVIWARAQAEELRLVGGGPELGSWDPEKAPVGSLQSDGRFRFELQLPAGSVSAFKLVRKRGEEKQWESRSNRYVVAGKEALEIEFGAGEGS